VRGEHTGVRNGQRDCYTPLKRDKRAGGGELFIPKGVVITTLATEAWLAVFVLALGAKAALSWLI
jgi:hypothetical protein